MNNVPYEISIRRDNCCDKLTRLLCCSNNKIYKYDDENYENIIKFVKQYGAYNRKARLIVTESIDFKYINNFCVTFTNIYTYSEESISILLDIDEDGSIKLCGKKSLLNRIEVHKW